MRALIAIASVICVFAWFTALARPFQSETDRSGALASTSQIEETEYEEIAWRKSISVGLPFRGALINGVQLPPEGPSFFTFDPVLQVAPNRDWRRWGADTTIRSLLSV